MSWKMLPVKEWQKFKTEKLEEWLKPVKLEEVYEEANDRYDKFMYQKRLEAEVKRKAEIKVEDWEISEDPERKAGWRGQKWFSEMLFDLWIVHNSELKSKPKFYNLWLKMGEKLSELQPIIGLTPQDWLDLKFMLVPIQPDISIVNFGTIEVKTMGVDQEIFNVKKKAWDENPSDYLVVLKICDQLMLEFQFMGWFYKKEVFKLPVETEVPKLLGRPPHYYGSIVELRKPRTFLNKLLKISRANPSRPE